VEQLRSCAGSLSLLAHLHRLPSGCVAAGGRSRLARCPG